ncbi:hypothetical protein PVOR_00235 [Paenibacillus vortex V453]|uniref:Uncharacterized protein n=1 Tax=Paenibacillus vortex V453 TaxID=715225 RepID=A0A2R9T1T2_9BACL|nr:hypothetical protein PVOR_00235 [Paenibacillus vortex V453]
MRLILINCIACACTQRHFDNERIEKPPATKLAAGGFFPVVKYLRDVKMLQGITAILIEST